MTKRELISSMQDLPDNAEVMIKNLKTNLRYNLAYVSWKNSSERIILNFKEE